MRDTIQQLVMQMLQMRGSDEDADIEQYSENLEEVLELVMGQIEDVDVGMHVDIRDAIDDMISSYDSVDEVMEDIDYLIDGGAYQE